MSGGYERRAGDSTSSAPIAATSNRVGVATPFIATFLAVLGAFAPPILIGSTVVTPIASHAAVVAAAVVALMWCAALTGRPRLLTRVGISVLCTAVFAVHFSWSLPDSYTVLDPAGPDGCRVVVQESAFLMSGRGTIGLVGRNGGPVRMVADYSVDDGATPVRHGNYSLEWGSDGIASLTIADTYDGPGEPHLTCRK